MKELSYPFDSAYLLKNRRKIKRQLADDGTVRIRKKIAVLGGSTTNDIVSMLEIFLLEQGIECEFYQSEYAKYWEDIMFANEELLQFKPDLIYIHTTARNITEYDLDMKASRAECGNALNRQFEHFKSMWERIEEIYSCPIIQNNFEMPIYRILGNRDAWDYHGQVNFISRLNIMFYDYALNHENFYINDINYLSACCGLDKWSEPSYWYMYKYAVNPQFIPDLAFNISNEKVTKSGYVGTLYGYTGDNDLKNNPEDFVYYKPSNDYTTTYYSTDLSEEWEGNLLINLDNVDPVSWYLVFMGTDQAVTHVSTDVNNGRKLAIIKDSYGNALVPCLTGSFEDIYVIDMRYFDVNAVSYLKECGVTDLLFAMNTFSATGSNFECIEQIRTQ